MTKMSTLLAAMLFASVSAYAAGQGATSVQTVETANKSNGAAAQGLDTAEKNISKDANKKGMAEKAEHATKPERPSKPERPTR